MEAPNILLAMQLLAEITPADNAALTFWALGSLAAVVATAERCIAIWDKLRTKPANSEVYATKAEVKELVTKVDGMASGKFASQADLREVHGRVDQLTLNLSDKLDEMREAFSQDLTEHRKEMKDLMTALAAIHRSLGQLEGRPKGGPR